MDIREYNTKSLPYHFVLFYNMPENTMAMYRGLFSGKADDNAVLTYCYLDSMCGLSYKVICCAKLYDNETIEFDVPEHLTNGMTIREGGLECEALLFDEGGIMSRFQKEADSIKENYGYYAESLKEDEDVPFAAFRHVAYPNDIQVYFFKKNQGYEEMWVREHERRPDGTVIGTLLNEPYDQSMEVHEGDSVKVFPYDPGDGNIVPVAVLSWMEELKEGGFHENI
ncbi:MAG: hypothetical protein K6G27_08545 [Lachnospiraceae bacterium]|nr:hypothetical protein [Lachnospiraceae bacterium]